MLKIEPFVADKQKVNKALSKHMLEKEAEELANPFSSHQYMDALTYALKKSLFLALVDLAQSKGSRVVETWIDPSTIKRIDVMEMPYTKERFLRITTDDGEIRDVKGESVQEFLLSNIVLGNIT